MGDILDSNNIQKQNFEYVKNIIDKAFEVTCQKYGEDQAVSALSLYLNQYVTEAITNEDGIRDSLNSIETRYYEIVQFLLDFAISYYISHDINETISSTELYAYTDDANNVLDYDPEKVTKIVAVGACLSPYWCVNLLACNKMLKQSLIKMLIAQRYVLNKKEGLDTVSKGKIIQIDGKYFIMNRDNLNNDIRNMNHDDEIPDIKK